MDFHVFFVGKYAKLMGLQEPTEFFVVQKNLGNTPNVLDRQDFQEVI